MKTVSYKGKKWNGEVCFSDPLSIEQEAAWEVSVAEYMKVSKKGGGLSSMHFAFLPGILACVEEWHIKGLPEIVTVDNFPSRPRKERAEFIGWVVEQVTEIYKQEDDDPNA